MKRICRTRLENARVEDTRPFPGECRPYLGTEEFSWSLEGCRSSVADGGFPPVDRDGVVPGNRNANVDALFQRHSLMFPPSPFLPDRVNGIPF
jgi:hypothetical protein